MKQKLNLYNSAKKILWVVKLGGNFQKDVHNITE